MTKALSTQTQKRWIEIHQGAVFSYNTTLHRTINATPMEALRGRTAINRRIGAYSDAYIEHQESGLVDYTEDVPFVGTRDVLDDTTDEIEYEIRGITVQAPTVDEDYMAHYEERMVHYHSLSFNSG